MRILLHFLLAVLMTLACGLAGLAERAVPRISRPAPPRQAAKSPAQLEQEQNRSLQTLTGRVEFLEQRAKAAVKQEEAAAHTAILSEHRAIVAINVALSVVVVIAAIFAFFGLRGARDIRRMLKRIRTARHQVLEEVQKLRAVNITEEIAPDVKAPLEALGRRLEILEELGQPLDAEDCIVRGNAYYADADYALAIQWYQRAIEIRPDFADAHYRKGVALHRLGRNEEALASFERVIQIKPDDPEPHYIKGLVLHQLGKYDEANASYSRAIALAPTWSRPYLNRARAYSRLNRKGEALADLARGIELDPKLKHDAAADPDLQQLRGDSEFRRLVGPGAPPPS